MAKKLEIYKYRQNGLNLEVPIYFDKGGRNTNGGFSAAVEQFDISVFAETYDGLINKLFGELNRKSSITWQSKLYVQAVYTRAIDEMINHGSTNVNFELKVTKYEVGTNLANETFWKKRGYSHEREPPKTGRFESRVGYGDNSPVTTILSFIDDTPENREALRVLKEKFDLVFEKVIELFKPETIQKTLAGGLNLLAAGEPKTDEKQP